MHGNAATPRPTDRSTSTLRVCHVAYTFYDEDNRVTRYAQTLADAGHHVDVISLRRPGQPRTAERDGVHVFRVQRRSVTEGSSWTYLAKLLLFLVRSAGMVTVRHLCRRYDVIHVHNVPDFLVFAALAPRVMGTPVILDIHDVLPELYAGKFNKGEESGVFASLLAVERLSCRFASHVIVANDIWRGKLVRRSVQAERCTTVLNYPDLRLFTPAAAHHTHDEPRFVMLYPGSLNRHQGLNVALEAFALARDRLRGAEFQIYGEGPALIELRELTATLGLQDCVSFHEPVALADVPKIMAGADVGIEPKLADSFSRDAVSTKILEFMACGIPVIASRTAAHAYYFNDTVLRFFRAGDPVSLSEAMVEYYDSAKSLDQIMQRARRFAVRYGWQQHSECYLSLVNTLVTSARGGVFANSRPAA